ncbi:MAG: effector binding domain-containing protein [Pseudomonadota bacterium]
MQHTHHDSFTVIGVSARVSNDDPAAIGALWETFHKSNVFNVLGDAAMPDVFCIYHSYEGGAADPYWMTIGFSVPAETCVPPGLAHVSVPAQNYAVFQAAGPQPSTLIKQWQAIWAGNLNRAFHADFDRYDANDAEQVSVFVGIAAD